MEHKTANMNQATAIKHSDVYGKELYYLKITNGDKTVMVNVGKTTYDKVVKLDEPETAKLIIDEKTKPFHNKNK